MSAVRGGPSQAVLELVTELKKRGVEIEIATTNDNGPTTLDVPLKEVTDFGGAPVRFFPRFSPPVRPVREFAVSLPFIRWFKSHARDYSLIHIHALFSFTSSAGMKIARSQGVPYIVRPSGLLCRWSLQQSAARKRLFLKLFDRANLEGSSALEFTAEQELEEANDLGLKTRRFVMPYGIHVPKTMPTARQQLREKLGLQPTDQVVLFLSRIHPKKGVHHLLSAALTLPDQSVHYVIAGSGDAHYESELKQLANQQHLRGRVHFVGFAAGEWKDILLQGSDIFVLPSHSESFAIAVMEALAVGLPVITTPDVPLAYLVKKFNLGSICQPNANSVAVCLKSELDSVAKRQQSQYRTISARLMRDNYAWSSIAGRMMGVYEQLLSGQQPHSFELKDVN